MNEASTTVFLSVTPSQSATFGADSYTIPLEGGLYSAPVTLTGIGNSPDISIALPATNTSEYTIALQNIAPNATVSGSDTDKDLVIDGDVYGMHSLGFTFCNPSHPLSSYTEISSSYLVTSTTNPTITLTFSDQFYVEFVRVWNVMDINYKAYIDGATLSIGGTTIGTISHHSALYYEFDVSGNYSSSDTVELALSGTTKYLYSAEIQVFGYLGGDVDKALMDDGSPRLGCSRQDDGTTWDCTLRVDPMKLYSDCTYGTGTEYRGYSNSVDGVSCQDWSSSSPNSHSYTTSNYPSAGLTGNFCRNPGDWFGGPFCVNGEATSPEILRCYDIPICTLPQGGTCEEGSNS
eukprot:sb/3466275/